MLRTISILALLACSAAIMAEAKPVFIKVFAPSGGYSSQSYQSNQVAASPINTQLISSLISSKIQLLNSVLQAKSSAGGFSIGFNKFVTFSSTTTTTEKPVTHYTTEVNTDFTPDDTSSTSTTQLVYTTTTEGAVETPSPTVHPELPASTTSVIPAKSTTSVPEVTTTTKATPGYIYGTAQSRPGTSSVDPHYLPPSAQEYVKR